MKASNSTGMAAIVLTGLMLLAITPAAEAEEKNPGFDASIYLWYASLAGQSVTGRSFDIDASDLIEDLDVGVMTFFEARMGKLSLLTDVLWMEIQGREGGLDMRTRTWVVTPAIGYNLVETDGARLDVVGGARYGYMKASLDFTRVVGGLKLSDSGETWDGIVGLRGAVPLGGNWRLPFYFDVGAGDSDLTWQALGGVAYQYDTIDLFAGYRHLEWSFRDSRVFDDLNISGPYAGIRFKF